MPTTPASTKDLPLPVRIFRAAMEQQRSLADYAQTLDISADSLRAIVTAQLDDVEPSALDRLADLYQQSRQTLREQFSITPPQESFAAWLKRNMEGMSQQALRTRVQLDSKTLKRFLNGEMLPDSDQAERLARALYIDRTELARVVTATMIHQADARHLVDRTDTSADQLMPAPAHIEEQAMIHPPRTRRQKATFQAEQTSAEGPAANGDTTTADTVRKPRTKPEADKARRPAARRQAGTKTAAAAVVAQPNALAMETDGTVPPDRNGPTLSTSDATAMPTTAPIPTANTPRPAPSTASTTTALGSTAALTPSVVAADTTTLQLTADEVRLIRHWRQLHPHGRRATLHYIGSLLVED